MMGSFQDEIAAIRRNANAPIIPVTNTAADIAQFEEDSPGVVNTICEEIKNQFREKARSKNSWDITHNSSPILGLKVNPHYYVSFGLLVQFDKNIGFKHARILYSWSGLTEGEWYNCLYVKTPEFPKKIIGSVAEQLRQDNIFSVRRDGNKTKDVIFPSGAQLFVLDEYFESKYKSIPAKLRLDFAYLLE